MRKASTGFQSKVGSCCIQHKIDPGCRGVYTATSYSVTACGSCYYFTGLPARQQCHASQRRQYCAVLLHGIKTGNVWHVGRNSSTYPGLEVGLLRSSKGTRTGRMLGHPCIQLAFCHTSVGALKEMIFHSCSIHTPSAAPSELMHYARAEHHTHNVRGEAAQI